MAKATKALSGASQTKYFRDLFGTVGGLTDEAADLLLSQTEREISQVRVRLPIPKRSKCASKSAPSAGSGAPVQPADAAFDPFAFSVVVVLTKDGRDGLAARLAAIERAEDLITLAKAQHIGLPDGLQSAADLRTAIMSGAERRMANRKAAAS